MTDTNNRPAGAILLSYIGGLLVLFSGISIFILGSFMSSIIPVPGVPVGVMIITAGIWGIICGVFIIAGGYLLQSKPREAHTLWGILIFVFALTSYFGGGGFFIGGILGIVGGLMAVSWNPDQTKPKPGKKENT
jgi:MFS family permease